MRVRPQNRVYGARVKIFTENIDRVGAIQAERATAPKVYSTTALTESRPPADPPSTEAHHLAVSTQTGVALPRPGTPYCGADNVLKKCPVGLRAGHAARKCSQASKNTSCPLSITEGIGTPNFSSSREKSSTAVRRGDHKRTLASFQSFPKIAAYIRRRETVHRPARRAGRRGHASEALLIASPKAT